MKRCIVKFFVSLSIVLLFICFNSQNVLADGGNDFKYDINNNEITITGYKGSGGDVTIPETIEGYPVTIIDEAAFSHCKNLTSVTMPSVITIEDSAFSYCKNLTSVTMPSVNTIDEEAFRGCTNLTSVTMPSVLTIGEKAFELCENLTSVSMSLATTIGEMAFWMCKKLTSVDMPSVTTIGEKAFSSCKELTNITLPSSVASIGEEAFWNCVSSKSIIILSTNAAIGDKAFETATYCIIYCYEGSSAEIYAKSNGNKYGIIASNITLTDDSLTLNVGDTYSLTGTVTPANGSIKSVTWSSDDTDVVAVDNEGKLTCVGVGTATITATTPEGNTDTCTVTVNPAPNPNPNPSPDPSHEHNWVWETITEPTEYSDGMEGYVCTICKATKDTTTIPSTGVFMENRYKQILNAKAGDTVVLEMGPWHSLSKGFMEEIARRRDVTFVIHATFEHKNYEVVMPAGTPIVLDPKIDWYGPLKQNQMFGMKEI